MAGSIEIEVTHDAAQVALKLPRKGVAANKEIAAALRTGAVKISRSMKDKAPKDLSNLTNAITVKRTSLAEYRVIAAQKQAVYMEDGTKPGGRMPLSEVMAWMKRKSITPRTPGHTVEHVAWLIQRKIVSRGVRKQPFAAPALKEHAPSILVAVKDAIARGLQA